ncbi:hypothetical protein H9635_08145 [Solibacillus sp. A46]|uniref:Uncharacterized protein n=1 Tax=Solibacillus faecavium TaxID=2762221 RepID=A0ABR8XXP8_9BACL|nr:hypothetical protein [Solibacillus faecavium]MBD8036710.1 hypothetical protein [Solibacillus faecavium]
MDGSLIILYFIVSNLLALYLYRKKKIQLWISGIVMALLVPVITYSFISLDIYYSNKNTGDGYSDASFGGGTIAIILALNAIVMFVIGVILNIFTFIIKKRKARESHVLER